MRRVKRAIVIAAFVAAVLGALAIRVVVEGRAAIARGDEAMASGRTTHAIRAYETAARWYLPLAPHVDDAYVQLRTLAASSDPTVALAAWRAIRGAARATRTLWTPHADDLAAADAALATLSAGVPAAATTDPGWHREQLARDGRPSIAAAALAGIGLVTWLAGAWILVRRGMSREGTLVRRPALGAAAALVLGVACWAVGLYNA
jgi:hypothetical protein